jgi:hypothetical protein
MTDYGVPRVREFQVGCGEGSFAEEDHVRNCIE